VHKGDDDDGGDDDDDNNNNNNNILVRVLPKYLHYSFVFTRGFL